MDLLTSSLIRKGQLIAKPGLSLFIRLFLRLVNFDDALSSPESFRQIYAGNRIDAAQFHKVQEKLI